jgi:hypothetical protein
LLPEINFIISGSLPGNCGIFGAEVEQSAIRIGLGEIGRAAAVDADTNIQADAGAAG